MYLASFDTDTCIGLCMQLIQNAQNLFFGVQTDAQADAQTDTQTDAQSPDASAVKRETSSVQAVSIQAVSMQAALDPVARSLIEAALEQALRHVEQWQALQAQDEQLALDIEIAHDKLADMEDGADAAVGDLWQHLEQRADLRHLQERLFPAGLAPVIGPSGAAQVQAYQDLMVILSTEQTTLCARPTLLAAARLANDKMDAFNCLMRGKEEIETARSHLNLQRALLRSQLEGAVRALDAYVYGSLAARAPDVYADWRAPFDAASTSRKNRLSRIRQPRSNSTFGS